MLCPTHGVRRIELEILSRGTWTAGHTLVADRFPRSRVLRGDAVHLFTPAGGLGYNTAVDDASISVGSSQPC